MGKSTVLNFLASRGVPKKLDEPDAADRKFNDVFRVQSFEKQMLGEHCTTGKTTFSIDKVFSFSCDSGINAHIIGQERVILLDCQPLNSASVLDRVKKPIHSYAEFIIGHFQMSKFGLQVIYVDKKNSDEFGTLEDTLEIHSLQMAGLMFNICHAVVFVQVSKQASMCHRMLKTLRFIFSRIISSTWISYGPSRWPKC